MAGSFLEDACRLWLHLLAHPGQRGIYHAGVGGFGGAVAGTVQNFGQRAGFSRDDQHAPVSLHGDLPARVPGDLRVPTGSICRNEPVCRPTFLLGLVELERLARVLP